MGRCTGAETFWLPRRGNAWASEEDSLLASVKAGLKKLRGLEGENIRFKCKKMTDEEYSA